MPAAAAVPTAAGSPDEVVTKKRKVTLGSMLKKVKVEPSGDATTKTERDELEEYLAEPHRRRTLI